MPVLAQDVELIQVHRIGAPMLAYTKPSLVLIMVLRKHTESIGWNDQVILLGALFVLNPSNLGGILINSLP
jgi:hypothetical protein